MSTLQGWVLRWRRLASSVGRYPVQLAALEALREDAPERLPGVDLVAVDEIG